MTRIRYHKKGPSCRINNIIINNKNYLKINYFINYLKKQNELNFKK